MPATTWVEGVSQPIGDVDLVGDAWLTQPAFINDATSFTECSVDNAGWVNTIYIGTPSEFVVVMGVAIPVDGDGVALEVVSAPTWTESSVSATTWTEVT